ncbi:MAG: hypothetical protein RL344_1416 [Pseudomonadota bacterium]
MCLPNPQKTRQTHRFAPTNKNRHTGGFLDYQGLTTRLLTISSTQGPSACIRHNIVTPCFALSNL